ncbi:transmembrane protein 130-like [Tetranychus urticae]|uniref:transmembrane protein 130-like n=1 Tax=Tetranychus urticae TaxID=32264 RepID=UPI000D654C07|nr:transmembrane protein 130-like [Tetranychus urticae]
MRSLSSFFILCFVSFVNGKPYAPYAWSQNRTFRLSNSGPCRVFCPIQFLVKVTNEPMNITYEYRFRFDQFPQHDKTIVSTSYRGAHEVKFSSTCEPIEGNYTVHVDVWEVHLGVPTHSIGTARDTFVLYDCHYIEMHDNGPVTFDIPITFTVENTFKTDVPLYEYRFKFEQFPQHDKTLVSNESVIEYSVIFDSSSTSKPGNYTVQIEGWFLGVPSYSIGTYLRTFELSDSLIGFIKKDQKVRSIGLEITAENVFSTEKPVKLIAEIRDPTGYFMGRCGIPSANVTYKWIINDEIQEESSKVIERTFPQPQLNNISVIVTATKTNVSRLIQKSGSFSTTLKSQDPITNFTVDGPTEVKVFERLQLDCKIQGRTPPFHYDYTFVMGEPSTYDNVARETNETSFSIVRHFSEKGIRKLNIYVGNDVNFFIKTLTISVY